MFSTDVLGTDPAWIVKRKQNRSTHRSSGREGLQRLGGPGESRLLHKDALSLNYAGMQQEFLDGKEAMYPMGTWAASATAVVEAKFGVGVFRLPSFSGRRFRLSSPTAARRQCEVGPP